MTRVEKPNTVRDLLRLRKSGAAKLLSHRIVFCKTEEDTSLFIVPGDSQTATASDFLFDTWERLDSLVGEAQKKHPESDLYGEYALDQVVYDLRLDALKKYKVSRVRAPKPVSVRRERNGNGSR